MYAPQGLLTMVEPFIEHKANVEWESWENPSFKSRCPIRWKLLISGNKTPTNGMVFGIAEIPPGAEHLRHTHLEPETYFVTEGKGIVSIEEKDSEIDPGSIIYIPSEAPHSVRCIGTQALKFIFLLPCDRWDHVKYNFID